MEEKKNKSNMLTIILIVLLLIAVGVIFYLLGINNTNENNQNNENNITEEEKQNNQDSENNTNVEEENTITPVSYSPKCSDSQTKQKNLLVDIDETKYNNISEYIQAQKNISITITSCEGDENNPNADELGMVWKKYILTESQKNTVLNSIKDSSYKISNDGIGGVCVSSFEINYERKDKIYSVSFWGYFHLSSDDGNIYKIIDKTVTNTLEQPEYCIYDFANLEDRIVSLVNELKSN